MPAPGISTNKVTDHSSSSSLLGGIKVVDLSRVMAGPYAAMLLGDYGADVIKVEEPLKGDETHSWFPPKIAGESAYFLSANRNKRDITINLKSREGLEILYKLVRGSDILIQNFRPAVLERLKIDYQTISKINSRIIYCSISGFGQSGPYRDFPGYDLVVFAMGGMMSITGEPNRPPVRVSVPIADLAAGLYSVTAILGALHHRSMTGEGQHIDVSMHDVQVSLLTHQAMNYFATGKNPVKAGSRHSNLAPYQAFETGDGSFFVLAVGNDRLWSDFCRQIGKEEWASSPRFRTNPDRMKNRDEITGLLSDLFKTKSVEYWVKAARKAGVPAGPILTVSQVLSNPHTIARQMVVEVGYPSERGNVKTKIRQLGVPVKFSNASTPIRLAPPRLGEHTDEILRELGYEEHTIGRLRKENVV